MILDRVQIKISFGMDLFHPICIYEKIKQIRLNEKLGKGAET